MFFRCARFLKSRIATNYSRSFLVFLDQGRFRLTGDSAGVECLVPAGGIVAMRPLLIHASSKSESELPRRVLHIEYASRLEIYPALEMAIS